MSDLFYWLFAGTAQVALFALLGWLVREPIRAWINRAISARYDRELEHLRSELRQSEERLKAEFRARDEQVGALRSNILSIASQRRAGIDKRRLEAVERAWADIVGMSGAKSAASTLGMMPFDEVQKAVLRDDGEGHAMRKFLTLQWNSYKLDTFAEFKEIDRERPFLSTEAFALATTYRAVLAIWVMTLSGLKNGMDASGFANHDAIYDVIAKAVPEKADLILDQRGGSLIIALSAMEEKVLYALRGSLDDHEEDKGAVKRSSELAALAANLAKIEIPQKIAALPISPELPSALRPLGQPPS